MNIVAFPVTTTNIFPAANTTTGGQLVTEYNLLSRESVATDKNVTYRIGPSYCHSMNDFAVTSSYGSGKITTEAGETVSSSGILYISPGRALVNGHHIESLSTISIDLATQNAYESQNERTTVSGRLCIGLRAMYSTESTIAGSIKVENDQDMFEGIQVVILPEKGESETDTNVFRLPSDVPEDSSLVTAHLKLATFDYYDGVISNITNNTGRCTVIDAWRINDVDTLLTKTYLSKTGLNSKKLYTFAGKAEDSNTGGDTWCDSTDALMVFDASPQIQTYDEYVKTAKNRGLTVSGDTATSQVTYLERQYPEAVFTELDTEQIALVLPHKQSDDVRTPMEF